MAQVPHFNPTTAPEPRVKPHLPSVTPKESQQQPRAHKIASQYQNNKAQVFNLGYFQHTETP